jgi:hypothetical protein
MATSGYQQVLVEQTFDMQTYLIFTWTRTSYSVENNISTISWELRFKGVDGGWCPSFSGGYTVVIDGNTYSDTVNVGLGINEDKLLASGTTVIQHNADGTKVFSYRFSQTFGFGAGTKSGSGTAELDQFNRKATITSVTNFTNTTNPIIYFKNPAGNDADTLQLAMKVEDTVIGYRDITNKTSSSYTWVLTTSERTALQNTITTDNFSKVVTFVITTIVDDVTWYAHATATFTFVELEPTLSPTVTATDSRTKTLTGDSSGKTLIKYFSDVQFNTGASASSGATIEYQTIRCGSQILDDYTSNTGTMTNIDSNTFYFSATDSRGLVARDAVVFSIDNGKFIEYIKLTSSLQTSLLTPNGQLTFTISGKYFNGSFGARSNTMEVEYSLRNSNGDYVTNPNGSGWAILGTVTPTVDGNNNYTYSYTISGLNHEEQYELSVNVIDEITPQITVTKVIAAKPIFEWGSQDFCFNVPVTVCDRFKVTNEGQLHGLTTDDSFIQAIDPCNHNNNLVIGYGNYVAETMTPDGAYAGTNVYGNTVNLMHKNGITINWTPLADFVTAEGSSGTWYYRKWNSGRVELYGYQNVSNVACTAALGSMYRTAVQTPPSFPFTVYSPKLVSSYESDGYGAFIWHTTLTTNSKPPDYYLVRPTSSAGITGKVHFHVQGSWK